MTSSRVLEKINPLPSAYAWTNYLLACGTCNQKWKGNLFPIEGGHTAGPTRKSVNRENPLLLNPYGKENPAKHLEFDSIGQISAYEDSEYGMETIRTCHLTRESLRREREHFAKEACLLVRRINLGMSRANWTDKRLRQAVGRLIRLGAPSKPHSGMVRILWLHGNSARLTWNDLLALRAKLHSAT